MRPVIFITFQENFNKARTHGNIAGKLLHFYAQQCFYFVTYYRGEMCFWGINPIEFIMYVYAKKEGLNCLRYLWERVSLFFYF